MIKAYSTLHPLIASYAMRHNIPIDSVDENGRLSLVVDERYRVQLKHMDTGGIALYSRLCALPEAGITRDNFIIDIARLAFGMLSRYASTCVVDSAETALGLQQSLRSDSSDLELDEALGEFVNALSFWSPVVRRVA